MTTAAAPVPHMPGPGRGSDYADLLRIVRQAGLLARRPTHYAVKGSMTLLAFAGVWVVFAWLGDTWWQLFVAAALAVVYTQVAFLGHDAGHRQILRTRRANDAVGIGLGGLVGMSFGWWVGKHNRHHANPNVEGADPDIDIAPLAFTPAQGRATQGFLRWMAKHQASLFFPLLFLEGFDLHWSGIKAVRRGGLRARWVEATLLTAHIVVYLAAVFLVLSPGKAVVFIVVHQGLWGFYMGCSFAPNHKGMLILSAAEELDFLRRQVLTSHDVLGGRGVDFALGGLNFQIEHHLFPSMPRPTLRRAQPLVQAFCAERGISYSHGGLLPSYGHILRYLDEIGASLRGEDALLRARRRQRPA
ncbi:acyl-CoA desaturase [Pseudonocardia sp. N23]|uniref:fatty acid desaturase family protein n=1 Tax=Pseudonocardia sp. N23 TaxID=1987376 RepID=UPI000C030012|nr:acyl-CoA desaturase [Pseudonocardia sp. N23]GAY07378.1 fatty acid desaturase [Pseudonocardia sp. N23]